MEGSETVTVLSIQDLRTFFYTPNRIIKAVNGVDLNIAEGEVLGLFGESGSGKTTLTLSILRLLPPSARIVSGRILFKGHDILHMSDKELNRVRGRRISMIFQDPRASLDAVYTIGSQIDEAISLHLKIKNLHKRTTKLLKTVRMPAAEKNREKYPFELSEGMCQRAMLALALSCTPDLLIADEPTTNLDATIQVQLLRLLKKLTKQFQMSILIIGHDFGVLREISDMVAVMYAGKIVEEGPTEEVFADPKHPYTSGLIQCAQSIRNESGQIKLIRGRAPDLGDLPKGCLFHPRCDFAMDKCKESFPPVCIGESRSRKHKVRCFLYSDEKQR